MTSYLAVLLVGTGCHKKEDPGPQGPPTLVASPGPGIELSYPDLVFEPDGTLWVAWTEVQTEAELVDAFVARSTDGGATFEAPIQVDDVDRLFLGGVRQPILATDGERVVVAVGGGSYLDSSILLYVADTDDAVFHGLVIDEAHYSDGGPDNPTAMTLVDQPEVAFDAGGQLMLNWKQGSFEESFQLVMAREADGYAISRLEDGIRGQPCECCPADWLVLPDGVLLAFRNNDRNLRDIYVAASPDGITYGNATFKVSSTDWEIAGCPLDGPMLATAGDALVATWADASLGDSYQWWTTSQDQGRTWSPSALVYPDNVDSMTWPTVATAPDGSVWTSVVEILHETRVSSTTDLGATFTEHDAVSPDGELFYSELAAGPDGIGMVGVTEEGELWYITFEE